MAVSKETERQIKEHVTRLNEEAKIPFYKKWQTLITIISVATAIGNYMQMEDKSRSLLIAQIELEMARQTTAILEKNSEDKIRDLEKREKKLEKDIEKAQSHLDDANESVAESRDNIHKMLVQTIELTKFISEKEASAKLMNKQIEDHEREVRLIKLARNEYETQAIGFKKKVDLFREKFSKFAKYIEEDSRYINGGYYTKQALRELITLRYIKTPISRVPLLGGNIVGTNPYRIFLFLTYPEFAREQLDEQLINVSYPQIKLKGGDPLIIHNVSEGGVRFLGSYDGHSVPSVLTATITFSTLESEDTLKLNKECKVIDKNYICEDRVTIVEKVD